MIKTGFFKTIQLLAVLLLTWQANFSFAQINWSWAASGGMGVTDYSTSMGNGIDFDQDKNTYLVGCISSPAQVGTLQLNSYGGSDVLVVKYDQYGNPVWAKTAGGTGDDIAKSIKVGSDGYLYVCGTFYGDAQFDSLSINGFEDSFFVAKMDTNGNFIWIKYGDYYGDGNGFYNPVLSINTDSLNRIYLMGYCIHNTQIFDTVYTSNSLRPALFVTQLDSLGNMNWIHFKKGGELASGATGLDLAVDPSNNVIFTAALGRVDTSINGPNSNTYYSNLILGKLNSFGNIIWEKEYGDTSHYDWGGHPKALTLDAHENIYVGGIYLKEFILNPAQTGGIGGGFIAKFNSLNGDIIDANRFLTTNNSVPFFTGCSYDFDGNILYSGSFCGSMDFGGTIISPISSSYDCDNFLASYDTTGNFNWVVRYGYMDFDNIFNSASNNEMYAITGSFRDSLTIDSQTFFADSYTSNSSYFFIATKIKGQVSGIISIPNSDLTFKIYPNPATSQITFETSDDFNNYSIDLFSMDSRLIKHIEHPASNSIDISYLPSGTYFISLRNEKVALLKRFVKID